MRFLDMQDASGELNIDNLPDEVAGSELVEAGEAAAEVEVASGEIETAAAISDDIDVMADKVEETLPEGGMTEGEVGIVRTAMESYERRLTFKTGTLTRRLAVESFGGTSDKIQSTKLALEGFRETAEKVRKWIVDFLAKFLDMVGKVFDFNGRAAKKLAEQAAAVRASADKAVAGGKVKGSAILVSGTTQLSGAALVKAYGELASSKLFDSKRLDSAADSFKAIGEAAKDPEQAESLSVKLSHVSDAILPKEVAATDVGGEKKAGVTQLKVALPIGNRALFVTVNDDGAKDANIVARLTSLGASKASVRADGEHKVDIKEVDAGSSQVIVKLMETVESHMKAYEGFRTKISGLKSAVGAAVSSIKTIQTSDEEQAKALKAACGALHGTANAVASGAVGLFKYDLAVTSAVVGYATASVKGGKKEEATK